jgi:ubiquinone/menaquinone biosynthesis C-methylase UbiE
MSKLSPTQWTGYWHEDAHINSFGLENYNDEVALFWQQQLKAENYQSILDLACGNGAISWLANDILNKEKSTTSIIGIDFSDIRPFEQLNRQASDYPMLSFVGNTKLESLPFEDNSHDAAISQYGVEYSSLKDSIAELSRVLKPTSKIHFIVHGFDSDIVTSSIHSLKQYEIIFKELQQHVEFLKLDKIIGAETNFAKLRINPAYIAQLEVIQKKMFLIDHVVKNGKSVAALVNYVLRLNEYFSEEAIAKGPNGRTAAIERAGKSLADYIRRIKDLEKIALSEQGINELTALLESHGFKVARLDVLKHGELNNAGRIIIAERKQ